ncbi:toxin-antitoxin system TumE family protein [Candidatus Hakubella thermalkaliphila]|uniref:toxin-antitoxin system TumE family protein n=1 Tax=Candidatus Hakubella thermalkaliphila TaxID=2754717 RepID=UPI001593740C|nr:DUF6516 family protein [Candidatus Hakubella thermalkaliphila]
MKAKLIRPNKVYDEDGNIIEVKMWRVDPSSDKFHGYKYSLVYIVGGERVIGYDNGEGRGDHRHYSNRMEPYKFRGLKKLTEDFYRDVERYREESL